MNDRFFSIGDFIYIDGFPESQLLRIDTSVAESKMDFVSYDYTVWFNYENDHLWMNVKLNKCFECRPYKFQVKKFKNKIMK